MLDNLSTHSAAALYVTFPASILIEELATWEHRRNAERGTIQWMFTVEKAREKMGRSYPSPSL